MIFSDKAIERREKQEFACFGLVNYLVRIRAFALLPLYMLLSTKLAPIFPLSTVQKVFFTKLRIHSCTRG